MIETLYNLSLALLGKSKFHAIQLKLPKASDERTIVVVCERQLLVNGYVALHVRKEYLRKSWTTGSQLQL